MAVRFINQKAKIWHDVMQPGTYLLLVTWGANSVQSLMTVHAFEAFTGYLSNLERSTVQITEILPESAARLGFGTPLVESDIHTYFLTQS